MGPAINMGANRTGPPQQPLGTPFGAIYLLRGNVRGMGAEATLRRLFDVHAQLLELLVEDPHQPAVPPAPHGSSEILRRDRVIRAINLNVSIPVNGVLIVISILIRQGRYRFP